MTTRRVYRWEKPAESFKYLVIYVLLWYFNLILPGVVSCSTHSSYASTSTSQKLLLPIRQRLTPNQLSALLYLVAERKWHGQSMEDLREDIRHREDVERTAVSLTEFIEKQGDENWADDLLQQIGPWIMVQLADMANFFESVRK